MVTVILYVHDYWVAGPAKGHMTQDFLHAAKHSQSRFIENVYGSCQSFAGDFVLC